MKAHIEYVTTYSGMRSWRDLFVMPDGLRFMNVVVGPGTGKSQMFTQRMPPDSLFLSGALSPVVFYSSLYRYVHKFVLLDDVDSLFRDFGQPLQIFGEYRRREITVLGKQNAQLRADGIPDRFYTTSRLCILANTLTSIEANLAAVFDRAHIISFEPTVLHAHLDYACPHPICVPTASLPALRIIHRHLAEVALDPATRLVVQRNEGLAIRSTLLLDVAAYGNLPILSAGSKVESVRHAVMASRWFVVCPPRAMCGWS